MLYLLVVFTNRDLIRCRLKKEGAKSSPFTFRATGGRRALEICVFATGSHSLSSPISRADLTSPVECIRRHSASPWVVCRPARIKAVEICRGENDRGGGLKETARRSGILRVPSSTGAAEERESFGQ